MNWSERRKFLVLYSVVTLLSSVSWVNGTVKYGVAYWQWAYDAMGLEMLALLNLLVWGCTMFWGWLLGPFTESDIRNMTARMHPFACSVMFITFWLIDPLTDDELALWLVWTVGTWVVIFLAKLATVRVEASQHMAAVNARSVSRLNFLLAVALCASLAHLSLTLLLFGGVSWGHWMLVMEDPLYCLLSTGCAIGQHLTLQYHPTGGVVDIDAKLKLIHRSTAIPEELVSVLASFCIARITPSFFIGVVGSFSAATSSKRLLKLLMESFRANGALYLPSPKPIELRSYCDPCAICYDVMCAEAMPSDLLRLQVFDASCAAALIAALPHHFTEDYVPNALLPPDPQPNSLVDFGIPESMSPRVLPCGHIFHTKCIQGWIQEKLECPVCKAPFRITRGVR
eukprot:TRINITY_DN18558_c0_g1_i1.p1 TRINITY_DN18558_c0_g1~~TRINITY_DN18558_c0_g1_i1.p1  ORF type:complete len:398 (+),score=81.85 TRINITY_DN18558_c0_g1_i1:142-1335(+)